MKHILISEWLKLRRKGMLTALLAAVAVTALGTVIGVVRAGESSDGRRGLAAGNPLSIDTLTGHTGLGAALGGAATLLGIITLAVVAASVAGEFSGGTLRNLLVREPRRARLILGKLTALAIAVTATVVLAAILAAVAAAVAATVKGYDVSAWWSGAGIASSLVAVLQLIAATLGWAAFGAVLALAFRSPVAAIGVGVVYALPLESILANISDSAGRWLPGKLFAAIAAGGDTTTSLTTATLTATVYVVAATAAATWWFTRTDVAA